MQVKLTEIFRVTTRCEKEREDYSKKELEARKRHGIIFCKIFQSKELLPKCLDCDRYRPVGFTKRFYKRFLKK